MKFVALISGGKDSIFAIHTLISKGHSPILLAHLHPALRGQEINSYMYQSAGSNLIQLIAEALALPLILHQTSGRAVKTSLQYQPTLQDQVEDLYQLLKKCKHFYPQLEAVSSGAIFSTYQKNRVQDAARRVGLQSLAPLWLNQQQALLNSMIQADMHAILIKVASYKLSDKHLGRKISQLREYFGQLQRQFGMNVCGQGGQYETIVLDCPLYKKRIKILQWEIRGEGTEFSRVAFMLVTKALLEDK